MPSLPAPGCVSRALHADRPPGPRFPLAGTAAGDAGEAGADGEVPIDMATEEKVRGRLIAVWMGQRAPVDLVQYDGVRPERHGL